MEENILTLVKDGQQFMSDHLEEYYCQITCRNIIVRSLGWTFMLDHMQEYLC